VSGHPLLTLLQPVKLGGNEGAIRHHSYVYATNGAPTIFTKFRDHVGVDPAWRTHELATGHMMWDDDLAGVTAILLEDADRT
jgi:hypothetical protein